METAFLAGAGVGGEDLLAAFTPARLEENRLVVIARRQRDGESKASLRETVNMAVRQ